MIWLHGIESIESEYEDSVQEIALVKMALWFDRGTSYSIIT